MGKWYIQLPCKYAVGNFQMSGSQVLLYYYPPSFYSTKARWYLEEKRIAYVSCIIDIGKNAHVQPEYMQLNPKGKVPMARFLSGDGSEKIIADSEEIMFYLEQFSDNSKPTLLPQKMKEQVMDFHERLHAVPAEIITSGAVLYPELTVDCKIPESIRKRFRKFCKLNVLLLG